MKEYLAVFIIALTITGLNAQTTVIPRIGYVIAKTTSDISKNSGLNPGELQTVSGFSAGVAVQLTLSERFSIQPELLYIRKGYLNHDSYSDDTPYSYERDIELKFNYLEIPVLFKATFGPEAARFYAQAGPSVSYMLKGQMTYSTESHYPQNPEYDDKDSDKYDVKFEDVPEQAYEGVCYEYVDNRLDLGLQFGAGVVLMKRVMIDIRYGLGLTKIYKDRRWDKESEGAQNRAIQFSVGVPLRLF